MGIGRGTGENRAEEAAKAAVNSPLLDLSIDGAKGVLFNITGGKDLGMFEIDAAARVITKNIDPEAKVKFGAVIDEDMGDEIRITVIASGFEEGARKSHSAPVFSPQEERRSIFGSLSQQPSQPPVQAAPVRQEQPPEPEPIVQARPEIRKPMFSPKPVDPIPKQVTVEEEDADDLEIPAFIRKKMR
jgi:cell division protein FtsZ